MTTERPAFGRSRTATPCPAPARGSCGPVHLAPLARDDVEQRLLAAVRVVGHRAARRQLEHALRHVGQVAAHQFEGVLLALGLVVDHARDAGVHLRPAERSLSISLPMPARPTTGGPPANTWLVPFTMMEKCEQPALSAPSPAQGPSATRHHRDIAEQADHRPGRIARDLVPPCCSTRRTLPPALSHSRTRGCGARARSSPRRSTSPRRSPRRSRRGWSSRRRRAKPCGHSGARCR